MVQLRRRRAEEAQAEAPADAGEGAEPEYAERINALEERIGHLEAILEGLQDAVHRESIRRGKQIERLESKTDPNEIRRALNRDARERGL